jgi:hypothetical protein
MLRHVALVRTETSVLTRATRRNIPEDALLHSHRRELPQILHVKNNCTTTSADASSKQDNGHCDHQI